MIPGARTAALAALYNSRQRQLQRIVAGRVNASGTVVEDACQTAWTALCAHPDVSLQEGVAMRWLITTATREAWTRSTRVLQRELPAGGFLPGAPDSGELAEPAAENLHVDELVTTRAHAREQLAALTDRERRCLYLQAAGYSYSEIAELSAASLRTVQKQILRGRAKLKDRSASSAGPRSSVRPARVRPGSRYPLGPTSCEAAYAAA